MSWILAQSNERPIYVLIDRLALSTEIRGRLVDAIETGYREAGEIVLRTVPRDETETAESLALLVGLRML